MREAQREAVLRAYTTRLGAYNVTGMVDEIARLRAVEAAARHYIESGGGYRQWAELRKLLVTEGVADA